MNSRPQDRPLDFDFTNSDQQISEVTKLAQDQQMFEVTGLTNIIKQGSYQALFFK